MTLAKTKLADMTLADMTHADTTDARRAARLVFAAALVAVLPALGGCSFSSPAAPVAANPPGPDQTVYASPGALPAPAQTAADVPPGRPVAAAYPQPSSGGPSATVPYGQSAAAQPAQGVAAAPAAVPPAPPSSQGHTLGDAVESYAEFLAMFRDPPEQSAPPPVQPNAYNTAPAPAGAAPAAAAYPNSR